MVRLAQCPAESERFPGRSFNTAHRWNLDGRLENLPWESFSGVGVAARKQWVACVLVGNPGQPHNWVIIG